MARGRLEPGMVEKQFKPGQSGNPKGRPKDPAVELRNAVMTKKEAREFEELTGTNCDKLELTIISLTKTQLEKGMQLPNQPIFSTAKMRAVLMEAKEGRTKTIDEIRSRLLSDAKEKQDGNVQVNINNCNPLSSMTTEELEAELKRLRKFEI